MGDKKSYRNVWRGFRRCKGNLKRGNWEPIIDEDMWWKAQDIRKGKYDSYASSNGTRTIKKGHKEVINIWQRKVKCECGFSMNSIMFHPERVDRHGKVVPAQIGFRCYNDVNKAGHKLVMQENDSYSCDNMCKVSTVNGFTYEVSAVKIMEILLKDGKKAIKRAIEMVNDCKVAEVSNNTKDLNEFDKSIAKLQKRIDNYNTMFADGDITREEYHRYKEKAGKEMQDLTSKRNELLLERNIGEEVFLDMGVVEKKLNSYLDE